MGRRRVRRVKYHPGLAARYVLSSDIYRVLAESVLFSEAPLQSGDRARILSSSLGRGFSTGQVNAYLRRLERLGVVRPYKNPVNGRLVWAAAGTPAARIVRAELSRRRLRERVLGGLHAGGGEEGL